MSKAVSRLFRDLADATDAVKHLKAAGYKAEEIGVVAGTVSSAKAVSGDKSGEIAFSGGKKLAVAGYLVPVLSKSAGEAELSNVFAEALGTDKEAGEYYEFTLGVGGVLVSVQASPDKETEVRAILGAAVGRPMKDTIERKSGFGVASRMAGTNPVDAAMTGDFRRY